MSNQRSTVAERHVIPLTKPQSDFIFSKSRNLCFVGGIGSGKTLAACMRIMLNAVPDRTYAGIFRSYRDVEDTVIPAWNEARERLGRDGHIKHTQRGWFSVGAEHGKWKKANIAFLYPSKKTESSKPEDIFRGINLSGFWMDEACYQSHDLYRVAIGRIRQAGEHGFKIITTSPKGKSNWVYREIVKNPDFEKFECKTKDNPFLSREFVADLYKTYGESLFAKQELEGEWIDYGNSVLDYQWILNAMTDHCLWEDGGKSVSGSLFVGHDVGGKHDAAATATVEQVGDIFWLRELKASRNITYSQQMAIFETAMRRPNVRRGVIDRGAQGGPLFEDMRRKFSEQKLVGLAVSESVNHRIAERMAVEFQNGRIRIPHRGTAIGLELERDLMIPQWGDNGKVVKARNETGHADRFDAIGFAIDASVHVKPSRVSRPPVIATHGIGTRRYTA